MDVNNLMQMANQLREKLSSAQNESRDLKVTGEAGGGMVQVVMNGQHELLKLTIDKSVLGSAISADDLKLLEDLLRAAVNQAAGNVGTALKEKMGHMAKDFGVDLSALEGLGLPK